VKGRGGREGRTLLDRSYWFVCDYCGGGCERGREERGERRGEKEGRRKRRERISAQSLFTWKARNQAELRVVLCFFAASGYEWTRRSIGEAVLNHFIIWLALRSATLAVALFHHLLLDFAYSIYTPSFTLICVFSIYSITTI
jgi:hypothetical protein